MTGALIHNMRSLDKPIIAAVNGMAAGAGAVIALASDLRVASDQAKFAFLHQGRTDRRGHGRGLSTAARRGAGARDRIVNVRRHDRRRRLSASAW